MNRERCPFEYPDGAVCKFPVGHACYHEPIMLDRVEDASVPIKAEE